VANASQRNREGMSKASGNPRRLLLVTQIHDRTSEKGYGNARFRFSTYYTLEERSDRSEKV